jgi:uncharacterized membrane protein YdjX (TVP38/TMEM64 family)
MTEMLALFINDAGWLAPLYYVASYVFTALVPVVPTPLVSALGGAAFGVMPAVAYGIVGLGLGAVVALNLARWVGRPLLLRLFSPKAWAEWEALLGIRSPVVWGIVFFVLNVDIAVVAAGMSRVPLRSLWLAAVIARLPWLIASAWLGDLVFVSDSVMFLALLGLIAGVVVFAKVRPRFQHWLVDRVTHPDATGDAGSTLRRAWNATVRRLSGSVTQARGRLQAFIEPLQARARASWGALVTRHHPRIPPQESAEADQQQAPHDDPPAPPSDHRG